MRSCLRFLICDDHAVVRRGLNHIITDAFSQAVICGVQNAEEMFLQLKDKKWDILILDFRLPDRNGLDALQDVKRMYPLLPVLALSVYPEEEYAIRFLKAGASGYLTKECIPSELVGAISNILAGRKYISPALADMLASDLGKDKKSHDVLSNREYEIMLMIAAGKHISEIADLLHLSVQTISTYRTRIFAKIGFKSNAEMIRYVIEHNLS
jgi:two-component system, NarL family, invasion response regulator UvrY